MPKLVLYPQEILDILLAPSDQFTISAPHPHDAGNMREQLRISNIHGPKLNAAYNRLQEFRLRIPLDDSFLLKDPRWAHYYPKFYLVLNEKYTFPGISDIKDQVVGCMMTQFYVTNYALSCSFEAIMLDPIYTAEWLSIELKPLLLLQIPNVVRKISRLLRIGQDTGYLRPEIKSEAINFVQNPSYDILTYCRWSAEHKLAYMYKSDGELI